MPTGQESDMAVNVVVIGGRLTKDPVSKQARNGDPIVEFGLAQNKMRGGEEKPMFFDVTAFGKTAEFIAAHFRRGKEIIVEGRLDYDQWESEGGKRSKVSIVAQQAHFVGPKSQDEGRAEDDFPV
jgi:single-strand DNA-binding protein